MVKMSLSRRSSRPPRPHLFRRRLSRGAHRVGKRGIDLVVVQNGLHRRLPAGRRAEDPPQGAQRRVLGASEAGHGHGGLVPRPGQAAFAQHLDGPGQALLVGLEPELPVVLLEHAGDHPVGPLQHLHHPAGTPLPPGRLGPVRQDGDPVPIPCAAVAAGRNKIILPLFRDQKAKAPAGGLIDPLHRSFCLFHMVSIPFQSFHSLPGLYYTRSGGGVAKKTPSRGKNGRASFHWLRSGR